LAATAASVRPPRVQGRPFRREPEISKTGCRKKSSAQAGCEDMLEFKLAGNKLCRMC